MEHVLGISAHIIESVDFVKWGCDGYLPFDSGSTVLLYRPSGHHDGSFACENTALEFGNLSALHVTLLLDRGNLCC